MNKKSKAFLVALCGILAALALVCLFFGGTVSIASIACPVLASLVMIPVYMECGTKWGLLLYATVGILGLILAPTKECAVLFIAYGNYPVIRKYLGRLPINKLWKLLYFNVVLVLAYGIMLFVFPIPELVEEYREIGKWVLGAMILIGNVSFFIYDILIDRLEVIYCVRIRPKIRLR